jgi:DNA-binding CsgD family transcriptional regulator
MATRGGDRSSLAARAATVKRDADVLERRVKGATTLAIAAALQMTQRGVQVALNRALTKIDIEGGAEAKRRAVARLDVLRSRLFERFDAGGEDVAAVARAIVAVDQREARLLGLDVPERLILAHLPDPNAEDAVTMAKLHRLTVEELETLNELTKKMNTPDVETTARSISDTLTEIEKPPAPDFDQPDDASPTLGLQTQPAPPPPAVAIGETAGERAQREAKRQPSPYDAQIEHLEQMLALSDTEADRTKFSIQLRDLKRQRDGR